MTNNNAVIVTGASRGIGAAIARLVAAGGNPVVLNHSTNDPAAESVASAIRVDGGEATTVRADLRREESILRLFDLAVRKYGRIAGSSTMRALPVVSPALKTCVSLRLKRFSPSTSPQ